MKIWSVSNQKGGVGKTTTVVTLGSLLANWGFRILLVDLDPHGSLTSYFKMNPDEIDTSVYNLFQVAGAHKNFDPTPYIVDTEFRGLSVLPAATAIATLDRQGSKFEGMGLVISRALTTVSSKYDYVLIDSPPMLGVLMINALVACDHLLVPVLTEFLALKGLERMQATLEMINNSQKKIPGYTIVPTMFDRRTNASKHSLLMLRKHYAKHLWKSAIPVDTKLRDASQLGMPAPSYAPTTHSVLAYDSLLQTLLRMESATGRSSSVP